MNCHETQELLHAYLDGELDLIRSLEIERHLEDCPKCAPACQEMRGLRARLRAAQLYHPAPAGFEQRLRARLGDKSSARARAAPGVDSRESASPWWNFRWAAWAFTGAALLVVAVVAILLMVRRNSPAPGEEVIARDIISSHIRSLMPNHLTDVESSDQHTVKPWFNGRLDFSPPVTDLASEGFPLVGGRLDYVAGRPVAALVYARRKHFINVFVWPSSDGVSAPTAPESSATREGYHLVHWKKAGMSFWAVSDLNGEELNGFAKLLLEHS